MLKNLSDYLSLLTLLFIAFNALRFFIISFVETERDDHSISRIQLIRDYLNNEEE